MANCQSVHLSRKNAFLKMLSVILTFERMTMLSMLCRPMMERVIKVHPCILEMDENMSAT